MNAYRISNKACEDLRVIGRYTQEKWGHEQREVYLSGMQNCFNRLARNPLFAQERPEFEPTVYLAPFEHHRVVFVIEDGSLLILRVLHESMDVKPN